MVFDLETGVEAAESLASHVRLIDKAGTDVKYLQGIHRRITANRVALGIYWENYAPLWLLLINRL